MCTQAHPIIANLCVQARRFFRSPDYILLNLRMSCLNNLSAGTLIVLGGVVVVPQPPKNAYQPFPASRDVLTIDLGGDRQWRWASTTALPRYASAAVVVGADVWLIGGTTCNRSVTAAPGDPAPTSANNYACSPSSSVLVLSGVAGSQVTAQTPCTISDPAAATAGDAHYVSTTHRDVLRNGRSQTSVWEASTARMCVAHTVSCCVHTDACDVCSMYNCRCRYCSHR